jgi:hypothetical protein
MNKVLILILLIVAGLSSCQKDDDKPLFNEFPDERLNETLDGYQSQLSGAENGWKALITTDSGKGATYSFYFKFNNENRVVMVSDFDSASAVTPKESGYRLKALQQPSLIFDTYSYLHVIADPDASQNGGTYGAGLNSDFEFYFDSVATDTIKLVGRFKGSKAILIRATKGEGDAYLGGQFVVFSSYLYKILTYFKRFTIESQLYDIRVEPVTRSIVFSWIDASGNTHSFSTTYYNLLDGIVLSQPFVNGNLTITSFTNAVWNGTSSALTVSAGGKTGILTPTVFPLKVDVTAARNWWQDAINNDSTYWLSLDGFHVDGVDDAFGLQSLTSGTSTYYYLIYWPGVRPDNDFFGPVFLNARQDSLLLIYGTAPKIPTFTTEGRAIFVQLGDYGPPNFLTYPATGPAALSKNQLFIAEGYYFVKTAGNNYDMISAKDGKSWISWILAQ